MAVYYRSAGGGTAGASCIRRRPGQVVLWGGLAVVLGLLLLVRGLWWGSLAVLSLPSAPKAGGMREPDRNVSSTNKASVNVSSEGGISSHDDAAPDSGGAGVDVDGEEVDTNDTGADGGAGDGYKDVVEGAGGEAGGMEKEEQGAGSKDEFTGGVVILASDKRGHFELPALLHNLNQKLIFARRKRYPVHVYWVQKGLFENKTADSYRELAPDLELRFHRIEEEHPEGMDLSKANIKVAGNSRGVGYLFCSKFLGHDMYLRPEIRELTYLLRIDDDVRFFTDATDDPFAWMERNKMDVGVNQWNSESSRTTQGLEKNVLQYAAEVKSSNTFPVSGALDVRFKGGKWDHTLVAGCVELYRTSVFTDPLYADFLRRIRGIEGIYYLSWREQAIKSLWITLRVPPPHVARVACLLPTTHHGGTGPFWCTQSGTRLVDLGLKCGLGRDQFTLIKELPKRRSCLGKSRWRRRDTRL